MMRAYAATSRSGLGRVIGSGWKAVLADRNSPQKHELLNKEANRRANVVGSFPTRTRMIASSTRHRTAQLLAEQPDRLRIRHLVAVIKAEEPAEAAPVEDLELRLVVRQAVEHLQNQDLNIKTASYAGRPAFARSERDSAPSRSAQNTSKSTAATVP